MTTTNSHYRVAEDLARQAYDAIAADKLNTATVLIQLGQLHNALAVSGELTTRNEGPR